MNRKRWIIVSLFFLLVLPLCTPSASALAWSRWDKIVAFGDSLSDNGNADGYGFGVWSNGPVWLDYMAEELGTELDDRALGGAKTSGHESGSPDYGLDWQVDLYISQLSSDADLSDTLFVVWIGGNDFLFMGDQDPAVVIQTAIGNITQSLQKLIQVGAKNILIMNLPDLGLAPQYNWDETVSAGASYLAQTFNDYELTMACNLNMAFPEVRFSMVDTYEMLDYIVENPDLFSFTNVWGADGAAVNYEGYLFWDTIHPTTAAHKVVAAAAIAKVKFCGISREYRQIIRKLRPLRPRMPFMFECWLAQ